MTDPSTHGDATDTSVEDDESSEALMRHPLHFGAPLKAQITFIITVVGLRVREIAWACGVTRQTVRNWRRTTETPRELRYEDLRMVTARMLDAGVEARLVGAWLRARDRGLGYVPPLDALRARRLSDVVAAADAFVAGGGLPVALPSAYRSSRSIVAPENPEAELEELTSSRQSGQTD